MAAAALGQAARRLGGSGGALRQAAVSRLSPAAEQLGQRRPLPRFTHTEAATGGPKPDGEGVLLKRIEKTKEELYDLMTEARAKYGTYQDRKLFQRLSGHIQPRPSDHTWRSNRSMRWSDSTFKFIGVTSCVFAFIELPSTLSSLRQMASSPPQD